MGLLEKMLGKKEGQGQGPEKKEGQGPEKNDLALGDTVKSKEKGSAGAAKSGVVARPMNDPESGREVEVDASGSQKTTGPGAAKEAEGKYDEPCSLCNGIPTDKKWAGKYFHKKCLRSAKRMEKGML